MNDRYLFKAKRIDNEEWVQGYYVNCLHPTSDIETGHFIVVYPGDYYIIYTSTLCQCTGLKDRNGNLIWENDVVRQFADCDEIGNNLYFFYQIKWDEKYARFYGHEIYTKDNVLFDELNDIEVIGSIIDNPELLEVE